MRAGRRLGRGVAGCARSPAETQERGWWPRSAAPAPLPSSPPPRHNAGAGRRALRGRADQSATRGGLGSPLRAARGRGRRRAGGAGASSLRAGALLRAQPALLAPRLGGRRRPRPPAHSAELRGNGCGPQRLATRGEWRSGRRARGAGRRGAALGGGWGSAAVVREPGPPRAAAFVPVLAALPPRREDGGGRGDGGRAGRRGTGRWGRKERGAARGRGRGEVTSPGDSKAPSARGRVPGAVSARGACLLGGLVTI